MKTITIISILGLLTLMACEPNEKRNKEENYRLGKIKELACDDDCKFTVQLQSGEEVLVWSTEFVGKDEIVNQDGTLKPNVSSQTLKLYLKKTKTEVEGGVEDVYVFEKVEGYEIATISNNDIESQPFAEVDIVGTWLQKGKTSRGFYITKNNNYSSSGTEFIWTQIGKEENSYNAMFNRKKGTFVVFFVPSSSTFKYNTSTYEFELDVVDGVAKFSKQ
ncbi:MAG: hypothetical protein WAQ28_17175 [Bacteroidia bacterium]|jgi:hypothetical protein